MILTEKQQKYILQLINASSFGGESLEEMFNFKEQVKNAEIEKEEV